jgi:hypothetical protein
VTAALFVIALVVAALGIPGVLPWLQSKTPWKEVGVLYWLQYKAIRWEAVAEQARLDRAAAEQATHDRRYPRPRELVPPSSPNRGRDGGSGGRGGKVGGGREDPPAPAPRPRWW